MDEQDAGRQRFSGGSVMLGTAALLPARAIAAGARPAAAAPAPAAAENAAGQGRQLSPAPAERRA